ncbi:hypothetical protein BEWA_002560 [Theileria equi strain WA]|uniref:Uncharacterized protein n=1 Tax=Theileria equi strain WA TaxID=1537102 RepID=L0B142_THEEQ|nr:hypothetical protein BEWA_002560 [Theileria equi strain WA]AFZ80849.1 hypothetical protein BEWA_002560 [Theileria equi strain WA]|eukprot:XP_004830515.1 hypothetical protein BEWA_002560 [Theileria equi strain WA]
MGSNLPIKTLVTKLTKLPLKRHTTPLNIKRLPYYYEKHKHISLFSGDWRRIKCDCVYLKTKQEYLRLVLLAKIANMEPKVDINEDDRTDSEFEECTEVIKNAKYVYFGDIDKFQTKAPEFNVKSLLIPLELLHSEEFEDDLSKKIVESAKRMNSIKKIAICAHSNHLWNFYNQLLRHG